MTKPSPTCPLHNVGTGLSLLCFVFGLIVFVVNGVRNEPFELERGRTNRFLQGDNDLGNATRTITIDFYRTTKGDSENPIIPKWRLWMQLKALNYWFAGRVQFQMGDVFETQDPSYLDPPFWCHEVIGQFSSSNEIRHPHDRISILFVEQIHGTGHGCATYNTRLGGESANSDGEFSTPAAILSMSNTRPLWLSATLGAAHWGGTSIAHYVGQILGFLPTAAPQESVAEYKDAACNLDFRYPQFNWKITEVFDTTAVDPQTGQTFIGEDWRGKYNIMNPLEGSRDFFRIANPVQIGLFQDNYEPIFDSILNCWFQKSESSTPGNNR